MMKIVSLFLLALLGVSAVGFAAEPLSRQEKPPVNSEGPQFRAFTSSISCEAVLTSLAKKEGASDFALLVSAFITGANYAKSRDSQADLKGMMMVAEKYCRDNPKQPVTNALIVLDKVIDQKMAQEKFAKPQAGIPTTIVPMLKPADKK